MEDFTIVKMQHTDTPLGGHVSEVCHHSFHLNYTLLVRASARLRPELSPFHTVIPRSTKSELILYLDKSTMGASLVYLYTLGFRVGELSLVSVHVFKN